MSLDNFKLNFYFFFQISAAHLSGDLSSADISRVYNDLQCCPPRLKLLYVTPEKISASDRFKDILKSLYKRNAISRFVIDEAHCVSNWGHDFRPDYKKLDIFRTEYPNVSIFKSFLKKIKIN